MKPLLSNTLYFTAGGLAAVLLLGQFAFNDNRKGNKEEPIVYEWHTPQLPKRISFAGEKVPIQRWDVKERFDRELLFNSYSQANILYILKLANRYFPVIEERLKANGVPDDFKYMAVAESNLQSGARSRSGAIGFWQFMSDTAPEYNMPVNNQVDFRYDVVRSTDAACKYLKQAYVKLGSWTAAAASYNCGQNGYSSQAAYQKTNNYYDLLLPEETNRYIFRILTFKHLMENAEELGYKLSEDEKYHVIPSRTVTIDSSISNLAQFALDNGTTYKILKLMNPWLRDRDLTVPKGNTYNILIPEK
ncbi:lytic transglycosylase domain-containing protein [Chitinophagaceae bacterium LB-8]|uniref:Lytic transglycosylase domain-containing protein n=1 Tax=Paraflavisolibacter caeni TaxID=2982496 RepID=A0A9X2XRU5_9BACT|nr:lytic transglycosylase domain-containing protein [Paraflavisolibacter caeni]MCU7547699.1 lytic transglycosylase domain-containing protein [Paraflavisolibacter caeni]